MSFEFLVKLEDQMSGPAAEAQSAIDKLTASIRRLQAQKLDSLVRKSKNPNTETNQIRSLRSTRLLATNDRDDARSVQKRSALERAIAGEKEKDLKKFENWADKIDKDQQDFQKKKAKAEQDYGRLQSRAFRDNDRLDEQNLLKKDRRQRAYDNRQRAQEKAHADWADKLDSAQQKARRDQRRLGLLQMDAQKEGKKRSSILYKLSPRTYNALNKEGSILGPAIVASVVYEAGKLAIKAVEGIYHAAEAVWDRMIPAINVREQGKIGFKYAFGEEGQEWASQRFDEMSRQMGRPAGELFDQAKMFGNLGASKEETNNMLLAISDTKAVGRDSGKLETAFESMLSRPTLSTRSFQGQLTGVINESKLWTQLAKDLSIATKKPVSVAQAGWLVQHNYVSGKIGRQALLETIQEQEGGRLGNASLERAQKTWDGMTGRMNATIDSLLGKLSEGKGWQTFTDAFNNFVTALENSDVRESIGDIADSLGSLFKPLTGDSGLEKIEAFFRRLNVAVQKSLDVILLFNAAYEVLPFVPHPGRVLGPIIDNLLDPGLPEKERNTRPVVHLPTMDLSRPHVMNVTSHVHIHGGVNDPKVLEHHVKKATKEAVQDVIDKLNTEDGGDQE